MIDRVEQSPATPVEMKKHDICNEKLKRACNEFESLFITYVLKTMRKTVTEGSVLGGSHESKIFTSMFDEKLGMVLAEGGGIGLGDMLFEKLKRQI